MEISNRYYKNIYIDYLFTLTKNFNTINGFWMIYIASKGLGLVWLGILEGIFHVTSMLMETPTGAIADVFGRKFSRLLGIGFTMLSLIIMLNGQDKWHFIVAFICSALSYNLESGAAEALVYDSLKIDHREGEFIRIGGRKEVIYQLAAAGGLVVGGYLATGDYRFPYYAALIVALAALFVGLFFEEVPLEEKVVHESMLKAIKHQYTVSFSFVKEERRLVYLAVSLNLVAMFVLIAFFYAQNYWVDAGISEHVIGILLAIHSAVAALGGFLAEPIEKRLGERRLIAGSFIILAAMYWLMYFLTASMVVIVLIGFIDSLLYVSVSAYMNHMIPSEQRATLLSFSSMVFSVMMILVFPVVGFFGDLIGLAATFLGLGVILSLITVLLLMRFRRTA